MATVLTPLSTKASPGNTVLSSSNSNKQNRMKQHNTNNYGTPKTPCRKRSQHTPRPMWSLPRAHFTCADSPSLDSDDSDYENENEDGQQHKLEDELQVGSINVDNKENMQLIINSQQLKASEQTVDQSIEKPTAYVSDETREQQTQKCVDSAIENIDCDTFSAVSECQAAPNNEFDHTPFSIVQTNDDKIDNLEMEQSAVVEMEQSPIETESTTASFDNNEEDDTLSPLPQRAVVVKSPVPSLAPSKADTTSIAASSAVTDLFAALRSTCTTECGEENDNNLNKSEAQLSPIHPQQSCLTAERKRWIHKTLLSKRVYTPYQTKEREECCKNKDSHELTSVRKRWIEETLLTPAREDALRKMSPKQTETHSSFITTALDETGQIRWEDEDPFFSDGGDESTVESQMKSPQQCQALDNSFLASALVATNMLLTPPRREQYSSKSSRPRMSIGATPLPFAAPFSPSSAASSAFTEAASNIILNAIKQLSPSSSANRSRNQQVQKAITPTRKSDLLSIVEKMDYLDKVNSLDSKDGDRSKRHQLHLEERVETLEKLIIQQSSRSSGDLQEEINELRRELQRSYHVLEKERQLVDEAEKRASMLIFTLNTTQETHNDVERLLRERIQNLELQVDSLKKGQGEKASEEDCSSSPRAEKDTLELDSLRKENNELLEGQKIAESNLLKCTKESEDLRSQLLTASNDCSEKEQHLASALDNLKQVSESFSHMKQKLENDVCAKTNEVKCMQRSLDLMSCELIESTNEVLDLRTENARLQEEIRQMRASKRWLFS